MSWYLEVLFDMLQLLNISVRNLENRYFLNSFTQDGLAYTFCNLFVVSSLVSQLHNSTHDAFWVYIYLTYYAGEWKSI